MKTGYFAHSVRGKDGSNADISDMQLNIVNGIRLCGHLRELLPNFEIYCPHEHEYLFQNSYRKGDITSEQILNQCLSILSLCDYLFVCSNPSNSEGVKAELAHALKRHIYVLSLYDIPTDKWAGRILRCGIAYGRLINED